MKERERIVERYVAFVLRNRIFVLLTIAVITAFFGYKAYHLNITTDFYSLYPPKHPYIQLYNEYQHMFGSANVLVCAVEVKEGDIYNTKTLAKLDRITKTIIGCAYTVGNALGSGFLEKVYENALAHELRKAGFQVEQQNPIEVRYDSVVVGDYVAGLLVENAILIELKAAKALDEIHLAQCMNYLKATALRVCLLINFGAARVEIKRVVNKF